MQFRELIGKKVAAVFIGNEKDFLRICTNREGNYYMGYDGEMFEWRCFGDCCSTSWIEHISGIKALLGKEVIAVNEIEMPDLPREEEYGELTQCYGWEIVTNEGKCIIEMRNESNGFYGGNLERYVGQDQYSSLENEPESIKWTRVTKDY